MAVAKINSNKTSEIGQRLTAVLGTTTPILPGESEEEYRQGLTSLIEELEADTIMKVYLAEKIFECLWWMRRYVQQKRATLAQEMGRILSSDSSDQVSLTAAVWMDRILDPSRHDEFVKGLVFTNYSEQSVRQLAFANKAESITKLDQQIALMAKTLAGFQASYEVQARRKLNLEKMKMQNELMSKDLNSVEMKALPDADQPQKTLSK